MAQTINPVRPGAKYHYESIQELIEAKPSNAINADHLEDNEGRESGESWYGEGIKTAYDCKKQISSGWAYGIKKVDEMIGRVKAPHVQSVKRRNVRGPEGDTLDIHKVNRGELDTAWSKRKRVSKQTKKQFTICANICLNANVKSSEIIPRGVASAVLAQALIKAGHSVELVAYAVATKVRGPKDRAKMIYTVQIKNFDSCLDIPTLVSGVTMAGFFRTLGFKAILLDPDEVAENLGRGDLYADLPPEVLGHKNSTVINVPPSLNRFEGVEKWLTDTVASL